MAERMCTSIRFVRGADSYKLIRNVAKDDSVWHIGAIRTPHGFVAAYADERVTILQIIHDSHEYEARIERGNISPRYLVTLANRFAREISA